MTLPKILRNHLCTIVRGALVRAVSGSADGRVIYWFLFASHANRINPQVADMPDKRKKDNGPKLKVANYTRHRHRCYTT